jgi:hypothetical protein
VPARRLRASTPWSARRPCAGRIIPVGSLPQEVAGNREDRDPDQQADQQRQVPVVELMLEEQNDAGDLAANGNEPRKRGEKAETLGGGLLVLRRLPILRNFCRRLVVGH